AESRPRRQPPKDFQRIRLLRPQPDHVPRIRNQQPANEILHNDNSRSPGQRPPISLHLESRVVHASTRAASTFVSTPRMLQIYITRQPPTPNSLAQPIKTCYFFTVEKEAQLAGDSARRDAVLLLLR